MLRLREFIRQQSNLFSNIFDKIGTKVLIDQLQKSSVNLMQFGLNIKQLILTDQPDYAEPVDILDAAQR